MLIINLESMVDLGMKLNKVQAKHLKQAKSESLIRELHGNLEKKLLNNSKSMNKLKAKQATLAAAQLQSLKDTYNTTDMTEETYMNQVNIVEQLSTKIGDLEELERAKKDLGDDATDSMKEYLDIQIKAAKVQNQQKTLMEAADDLTGGMVTQTTEFVKLLLTDPLSAMIVTATFALKEFSAQIDQIGEKFGAMGVQKFTRQLTEADAEMRRMGFETGTAADMAETLSSNFGRTFDESVRLAPEIADMAKSLGVSVEEGTEFFGIMTKILGYTDQAALDMGRMVEQLAVAEGVAPGAVMADIAKSTETFAKYSDASGKNIMRTAVQAKKLGLELDDIAGIADNLLDFSTSMENQLTASVMTGKNLNFQRARELALVGDTEGMMREVLNQVGSEEEFLAMNVKQREAIAAAAGGNLTTMMKLVAAEEEAETIAGKIAKQPGFEDLISEETMSNIASMVAHMTAAGAVLANTLGPPLNFVAGVFEYMAIGLKAVVDLLYFLSPALYVAAAALVFFKRKQIKTAIAGAWSKAMKGGPWGPWGIAASIAAALLATGAIMKATRAGDLFSPAKGKTTVSTKEGGLFELSDNDDLMAGPGIGSAGTGNVTIDIAPIVSAVNTVKEQIVTQQGEIKALRDDMRQYFGLGGSAIRGIGNKTATALVEST